MLNSKTWAGGGLPPAAARSAKRVWNRIEPQQSSAKRVELFFIEGVWDYDFDPGTNLVDVYVKRLREKIDAGFEPKLLQTVRGIGYVIKGPS